MKIENLNIRYEETKSKIANKVASGALALTLLTGVFAVGLPTNAYATGHKYGTYYSEELDYEFNSYKVEDDDLTASNVSSKILRYFIKNKEVPKEDLEYFKENPDASCQFWPVVAYVYEQTKKKSYHTRPGETIYFPKTYEELKAMNANLKKTGWFAKYCKKHNIYPKKRTVYIDKEDARNRVLEILLYTSDGMEVCVDDDTLDAYLKTLGGYNNTKYVYKEGAELNKNENWRFTELLLTPDEIIYPKTKQKTKTR